MHTPYSDGGGYHAAIASAAQQAGIDVVMVSDHNVLVKGPEGYHGEDDKKILVIVGEEIHDQIRDPQKNHLLVFGAKQELATYASDPQILLHKVKEAGGISFLAHPIDWAVPKFAEQDLSWVSWDVRGFTGIELWNGMTEFKSRLTGNLAALFYAFIPSRIGRGPFAETIELWEELMAKGDRIAAIGGTDAHAVWASLGPFRRILFPYTFHFKTINTHVLTRSALTGNAESDSQIILNALGNGCAFIGYDLAGPTRGFRFTAHCPSGIRHMGDEVTAREGVTLQIKLPRATETHLIKDGVRIRSMRKRETYSFPAKEPGVYRVECYTYYRGRSRGWIFSNPIYVR